ncbi:tRNA modification GTPase [Candidatus Kinetoplastibacterium blastocrithidii TCC012E]|uniref:tRNA modification GTPase MnmE n=1 Tax=Candidatus Kinetoplastidibacterium blastocrithidiae TCC012E TaxID=1208922 RepID=M1LCL3_9PROT|nr:tRNA uridine-5-carboxymethylaminomethyl(34) synthesis GTPase MnmE [Candidatus Kinetoplastibacterium blastocrithidii]AFZ83354.1 tRNA modification GTPase [Candidatus Kinetoplastibacterium blastocrithidii (ex Strigomonas culicis)]AGF50173.1 tRNA modification GTPase [Candidatus Kinetoplastibacterium blastocrithidii TCC012E]
MLKNVPIVAIATAHGSGGIGIIRISGKELLPLMLSLFKKEIKERTVNYLTLIDNDQEIIDNVIVIFFKAPRSFTGEDVIEIQCHGGMVTQHQILDICILKGKDIGVRLANPGEFTKRSFLNGKIDLIQAEAISDLINSSSIAAARSSIKTMSGSLSLVINDISNEIINLRVLLEANLDFPEEDITDLQKKDIYVSLVSIKSKLSKLKSKIKNNLILKNGINIVLTGRPNSGKSSLLNALSEEEIAIVTPLAGTTRDKVSNAIYIKGVMVNIIDTAGIRHSNNLIEKKGIEKSWEAIENADIVLHVIDSNTGDDNTEYYINKKISKKTNVIKIYNKSDLLYKKNHDYYDGILVSSKSGAGLDFLKKEILKKIEYKTSDEDAFSTRERHFHAVQEALEHIEIAISYTQENLFLDILAEELRLSHCNLCEITGQFTSEDMLEKIFSSFCIGK